MKIRHRHRKRTISDVTQKQWALLTEAAIDLLNCTRLMFLMYIPQPPSTSETSVLECMERMANALEQIGLPQGTLEEYYARLEDVLSGRRPIIRAPK